MALLCNCCQILVNLSVAEGAHFVSILSIISVSGMVCIYSGIFPVFFLACC